MEGYHLHIFLFLPLPPSIPLQYLTAHYLFYSSRGYFYSREQVVYLIAETYKILKCKKSLWDVTLGTCLLTEKYSYIFESWNVNVQKRVSQSQLF